MGGTLVRFIVGVPIAAVVVIALFMTLRVLVFSEAEVQTEESDRLEFQITQTSADEEVVTRDQRPPEPEPVRAPPPPPRIEAAKADAPTEGAATVLGALPGVQPDVDSAQNFEVVVSDREEQPLVRVPPQYPRRASERGVEGSCDMRFDIEADGSTSNVRADCTSPLFERAAINAVQRWKYQPRVVDGQAVRRPNGGFTKLDFELAE